MLEYPLRLAAARKHALKCIQMGPPWISKNPMTERIEYMHMERSVTEIFSQAWSLYEEHMETKKAELPAPSRASTGSGSRKGVAEPPTPESSGKPNKPTKQARVKTPLESSMNDAAQLSKSMAAAVSSANLILDAVKSDSEWKWADNEPTLSPLKSTLANLQMSMTPFGRKLGSSDMKEVRKGFSNDNDFKDALDQYKVDMHGVVSEAAKAVKRLMAMHKAQKGV